MTEETWFPDTTQTGADYTRPLAARQGAEGKREIQRMYDMIVAAHDMSHYNPGVRFDASQKRDVAQSELLAGLIDRLKIVKEPDGSSLFDHAPVVCGSNLHSKHSLLNCPTLIAGAGLAIGRHIVLPKNNPLTMSG